MVKYGYMYCETQKLAIMERNLLSTSNVTNIIKDDFGHKSRPNLHQLINQLGSGDLIYILSVNQLSNHFKDIPEIINSVVTHGGALVIFDTPVFMETNSLSTLKLLSRTVAQVIAGINSSRTDKSRKNQLAGIAAAKASGALTGKHIEYGPSSKSRHKRYIYERIVYMLKEQQIPKARISRELKVSRTTVYRIARELQDREHVPLITTQQKFDDDKSRNIHINKKRISPDQQIMESIPEVLKILRNM